SLDRYCLHGPCPLPYNPACEIRTALFPCASAEPGPRVSVTSHPGTAAKVVLQGRYQLERKLGEGGMSSVFLARDLRFGSVERWCAVKEIVNTGQDSQTRRLNLDNFIREANILASLAHQGIPKVYDFFSQDNRSYLVLEF